MAEETAPNTVRMPEVKITFTPDMSAVEDAFERLEDRAKMIGETMGVRTGSPVPMLDDYAKNNKEISASDLLAIVGPRDREPEQALFGGNFRVVELLTRMVDLLEEIRDATVNRGDQ